MTTDETENTAKQVVVWTVIHDTRLHASYRVKVVLTDSLPRGRDFGSNCKKYVDVHSHFETSGDVRPPELYQTGKDPRIIVAKCDRVNEVSLNSCVIYVGCKLFLSLRFWKIWTSNCQIVSKTVDPKGIANFCSADRFPCCDGRVAIVGPRNPIRAGCDFHRL